MAYRYEFGDRVEINYQRAVELFTLGAAQGHRNSIHGLGWCYEKGLGVVKDKARAAELFNREVAMGCNESCRVPVSFHVQEGAGNLPPNTKEVEEGEEGEEGV